MKYQVIKAGETFSVPRGMWDNGTWREFVPVMYVAHRRMLGVWGAHGIVTLTRDTPTMRRHVSRAANLQQLPLGARLN